MSGHEASNGRRVHRNDATTIRLGAIALPLGILLAVAATAIHPHKEDVMNNSVVFQEYANSGDWIAIHFAQWLAALLLFSGLLGVYYALRTTSGLGSALVRLGAAAAVQAAAAITALQAVDGIALKWAVDTWVAAPQDEKTAVFAAAEAVRWTEYAFQSLSNILLGLALGLYGLAIAFGARYPRWLGWVAIGSATAWVIHGATVPYVGLFDSTPRLVAMVLLAMWAFAMAVLMWRRSGPHPIETPGNRQAVTETAQV
jgi:MprA protease rhombosortase-interaction domain-containing protein